MKGSGRGGRQSQRSFYFVLGAVALVGAVALIYIATRPPQRPMVTTIDPAANTGEARPHVYGDPNAPVTIAEFADFQCGWCAQFAIVTQPDVKRRIVDAGLANYHFYDFPLPGHANAFPAAHAAACAADQGRFWEMHDQIFMGQNDWAPRRNPKGAFEEYARQIGLDTREWERCYDDQRHQERIQANAAEGMRRGVSSTPTFIIGNRMVSSAVGYDVIRAQVDSARVAQGLAPVGAAPAPTPGGGSR
ncbi:MAG TPA: thioredoxin domain-containing protein [Gemmatimonadaceae bacterium]|nr:thioredoxin domain-containing protein [Gemmatimonadaceae bacterium]